MSSETATPTSPGMSLTSKILIAMGAGIVLGIILNLINVGFLNAFLVDGLFNMVGKMFMNALKMLVVPLVIFSLICGVAGIGDVSTLGRVGGRSLILYVATTAMAIMMAIGISLIIGPGQGFQLSGVEVGTITGADAPSAWMVFANVVPSNPIAAAANGEMLQIIFYVIVLAVAALMLGDISKPFLQGCEYMNELMMKIVEIVMYFAPYGVFCLIAKVFAQEGIAVFLPVFGYVSALVLTLLLHCFVVLMIIFKLGTGLSPVTFLRKMWPTQVFAFSTASSSATIPVNYRGVTERMGVNPSVASFTIPFGATINMDGTAIMQGVATVFIANVYGVDLGVSGFLTVIGMAVLASIGTAGVPGVGMVMLTMVLSQVGLPLDGIAIILGVDRLMDMLRTAVNVTGDAVVTAVVAKSEGKLDLSVFNDPNAGAIYDDDLDIDPAAEARLADAIHDAEAAAHTGSA